MTSYRTQLRKRRTKFVLSWLSICAIALTRTENQREYVSMAKYKKIDKMLKEFREEVNWRM